MNPLWTLLSRYTKRLPGNQLTRIPRSGAGVGDTRRRTRLCLEQLEERTVPSHLTIVSGGGEGSGTIYFPETNEGGAWSDQRNISVGPNETQGTGEFSSVFLGDRVYPTSGHVYPDSGLVNAIVTRPEGSGSYSASAQVSATYQILPDNPSEHNGDPVLLHFDIEDDSTPGFGHFTYSISGVASGNNVIAHINDQFTVAVGASGRSSDPSPIIIGGGTVSFSVTTAQLLPTAMSWDTAKGGVDYGYQVQGGSLPADTTEALYWARGKQWGDRIEGPIAGTSQDILAGTAAGSHPLSPIPTSLLQSPPPGATYLLAVTDPDNKLGNFDPTTSVAPLALPDLTLTAFTYNTDRAGNAITDAYASKDAKALQAALDNATHRGIDYAYKISGNDLPVATTIAFYWSDTKDLTGQYQAVVDMSPGADSPSSKPILTSMGDHNRVKDGFTNTNDPARWGPAPTWAQYLVAVLDPAPDHKIVAAYSDPAKPYRFHAMQALVLHGKQDLLSGAVTPDENGVTMEASFQPGLTSKSGPASLSEAEIVLGVDHFNWLQWIAHIPNTWEARTVFNIDYNHLDAFDFLPPSGLFVNHLTSKVVYSETRETPFLDPIVTASATDSPLKYTRVYLLKRQPGGPYDGMIPWFNGGGGPLPDNYYPVYNEGSPGGYIPFYYIQSQEQAGALYFEDTPRAWDLYGDPFAGATDGAYVGFQTILVGVNYDESLQTWTNSGYKTEFDWQSNTVISRSKALAGGVTLQGLSGLGPPIDPSFVVSGGVSGVTLTESPDAAQFLRLDPISSQSITVGQALQFAATAQDAAEGDLLTYSLDPGAPTGARIDPSTGVFIWTPTSLGSFSVIVRVTDNSSPAVTDAQTFTITVTAPPAVAPTGPGSIRGTVFLDYNADGVQNGADPGLPGRTVYLDLHRSGVFDPGDPATTTDGAGHYQFTGIAPGTYTLRERLYPGVLLTSPPGGGYVITVTAGVDLTGLDFGNRINSPALPLLATQSVFAGPNPDPLTAAIRGIYRSTLGRDPGGLDTQFWLGRMLLGESLTGVAADVWESPEHLGLEVDGYYRTVLHREADPAGRAFWVRMLRSGVVDEASLFQAFLTSPEYLQAHPGTDAFVPALYRDVLGRGGQDAGVTFWSALLNGGLSPAAVVRSFIFSPDSDALAIDSLFVQYLGRPADPAGRDFWINRLRSGSMSLTAVAIDIMGSEEFKAAAASSVS